MLLLAVGAAISWRRDPRGAFPFGFNMLVIILVLGGMIACWNLSLLGHADHIQWATE